MPHDNDRGPTTVGLVEPSKAAPKTRTCMKCGRTFWDDSSSWCPECDAAQYEEPARSRVATMRGEWQARASIAAETPKTDVAPHPPEHILQFFAFEHLPPHLAKVSEPFAVLAAHVVATVPRNPERTVALRKLLESKDAAVRAVVAK